jgi:aspartate/methionine/tyrosine aminotransferase
MAALGDIAMKFSNRAESIAPFFAMGFGKRAAALEAEGHNIVKLSIGEPDFGAPPAVIEAMQEASPRPLPYQPVEK